MANLSAYLESGLLNYLFRSNTNAWTKPVAIAVALCSGIPSRSNTGATIPELANAGGYARVYLGAPANSIFSEYAQVSISGNINNASQISFPVATAYQNWASGVAILDSGVYGSGNLLLWAALPTPREILLGDQYVISTANLSIYLA